MIEIKINTDTTSSKLSEPWTVTVQQRTSNITCEFRTFDTYEKCAKYVEQVMLEYKKIADEMRPKLTAAEVNDKLAGVSKDLDEVWDAYHGGRMPEESEPFFREWWESTFGVPVKRLPRK